ncbi:MAG TPA: Lrp/AsnC family transcriptional regulator [Candidatus Avanaerovorax faecigallinarum]|nr:Lrp/AsnC family transcriptional regulator [Candidatus Avanaerovorax faecigallinarum]
MNRLIKFNASEDMLISTYLKRVTVKVTEKEQEILSLLIEDPAYTYSVLSDKLGISRKTVSLRIQSLKSKGIIKRIGSDTKGYWDINNDF